MGLPELFIQKLVQLISVKKDRDVALVGNGDRLKTSQTAQRHKPQIPLAEVAKQNPIRPAFIQDAPEPAQIWLEGPVILEAVERKNHAPEEIRKMFPGFEAGRIVNAHEGAEFVSFDHPPGEPVKNEGAGHASGIMAELLGGAAGLHGERTTWGGA